MSIRYNIFIPEHGGQEDIVFDGFDHKWDCNIEVFPFPLPMYNMEIHVDENGRNSYQDHNLLAFDFLCELNNIIGGYDVTDDGFFVVTLPFGPVGINVRNKALYAKIKKHFSISEKSPEPGPSVARHKPQKRIVKNHPMKTRSQASKTK